MITAMSVKNFKGIGAETFRLPIKPLTLLFGPNSAGKSTLLHALHYAREVVLRHNLDVDETTSGGRFVRLGGFRNLLHNRDLRREMSLEFELSLDRIRPSRFGPPFPLTGGTRYKMPTRKSQIDNIALAFNTAGTETKAARVGFTIRWDGERPAVSEYRVDAEGKRLATLNMVSADAARPRVRASIDLGHSLFAYVARVCSTRSKARGPFSPEYMWHCLNNYEYSVEAWGQEDALPSPAAGIDLVFTFDDERSGFDSLQDSSLNEFFSRLIVWPLTHLYDCLDQMLYIGPLRDNLPRDYEPPRFPDATRWAGGLAAWDALHRREPEFADQVSQWLSAEDRLDTGYGLKQKRIAQLDFESNLYKRVMSREAQRNADRLANDIGALPLRRIITLVKQHSGLEVHPLDLGMGISQVLPIVVACLANQKPLLMVEQPELHLHPRTQCALADLFIEGALGTGVDEQNPAQCRNVIVETHSEHLILRLLRRVRETTRGAPANNVRVTPDDISICYIAEEDGQSVPRTMHVNNQGDFVEPWPDRFFEQDFYERFG